MAFSSDDLLLSPDRSAQLEKALANLGVADPLQYLCDEAAAEVARMTTGYAVDVNSVRGMTRALALFKIYSYAGPVPKDIQANYDSTNKELEAIASGNRPNLPKATTPSQAGIAGNWGSQSRVPGRMET
jgi:hypothetical protein